MSPKKVSTDTDAETDAAEDQPRRTPSKPTTKKRSKKIAQSNSDIAAAPATLVKATKAIVVDEADDEPGLTESTSKAG